MRGSCAPLSALPSVRPFPLRFRSSRVRPSACLRLACFPWEFRQVPAGYIRSSDCIRSRHISVSFRIASSRSTADRPRSTNVRPHREHRICRTTVHWLSSRARSRLQHSPRSIGRGIRIRVQVRRQPLRSVCSILPIRQTGMTRARCPCRSRARRE